MSDPEDCVANKSQSFTYENCIIREREDSDVSNSSTFSWRPRTEDETSFPSESSEVSSQGAGEDLTHSKVNVKESFILMLGFLSKVKKYFDGSSDSVATTLNDELKLLERVLINSAESFGYNVKGCNGRVEEKKAKTAKQKRNDTSSQLGKMNGDAEINSPVKKPTRRSTRIRGFVKNGEKRDAAVEKMEQKRTLRKRKIESVNGDDRRVSKRVKHNVGTDRLSCTASKIKLVTDEIRRRSLSPVKVIRKTANLGPSSEEKSDESNDLSETLSKSSSEETSNDKKKETRSGKKKLYSLESWLDTLSDMMC